MRQVDPSEKGMRSSSAIPRSVARFQSLSPLGPVSNLVAGPLIGGIGVPAALLAAHGPERLAGVAVRVGDQAAPE